MRKPLPDLRACSNTNQNVRDETVGLWGVVGAVAKHDKRGRCPFTPAISVCCHVLRGRERSWKVQMLPAAASDGIKAKQVGR